MTPSAATTASSSRGLRVLVAIGLAGTLALLLAHAAYYAFLTDDAFISFRYARNLGDGYGLVFNPGFERVEGYTNFLWVVMLAVLHFLGLSIVSGATFLSLAATVGLWAVVARFAWSQTPADRPFWVLSPLVLLGLTRSVAVWSTSGLETRLFELLVVAGVFRLLTEIERGDTARPLAAVLLALATLTRPDALLISISVFGVAVASSFGRPSLPKRWLLASSGVYAALVGSHTLFRYVYYSAWVPNTYHAKVGGRLWWDKGFDYLQAFVIEYALYLWIPFLVAAIVHHRRRRTLRIPALFAAAVLPHASYILAIGGDHFEYRPLDLYFPFLFLAVQTGALALARSARSTVVVLGATVVIALLAFELPWVSHRQFPKPYLAGFPGGVLQSLAAGADRGGGGPVAERYLEPEFVYRLPGLRRLAERHRGLIRSATRHFIGIRQEEHARFLATADEEGRRLAALIERGLIPPDTHVAIDCVGAIPYRSDLRTLDRLGLTDARVAKSEFVQAEIMAHGKYASLAEARERGVDLWAVDAVHLLLDAKHPEFARQIVNMAREKVVVHFASVGEGRYLAVELPQGLASATRRFPSLEWRTTADPDFVRHVAQEATRLHPRQGKAHARLANALFELGDFEEAVRHYDLALEIDPSHNAVRNNLALSLSRLGRLDEAASHLEEAIRRQPDDPVPHVNLGTILLDLQEPERARLQFERALALDPTLTRAREGLAR